MLTNQFYKSLRLQMVEQQLIKRGIHSPRVLEAMRKVPRHRFVPHEMRQYAYNDVTLPIGEKQTITQPYIVGLMTEMLNLQGHERVLEIGTGCGYQTAILCELADYVYTLERSPRLADRADINLHRLGYENLDIHIGDGSQGLPDMTPYDAIMVTAAAPSIPGTLAAQLNPDGGRLIVPVGTNKMQHLYIVRREGDQHHVERGAHVQFPPLIGLYGFKDRKDKRSDDSSSAGV